MNLAHDIETAARAWIAVGVAKTRPEFDNSWERGYKAALRACGERAIEILDDHVEVEHADAVARGVTS